MSTRDRIIDTAIQQFNKRGYELVTLAELAEILGISRGNLAYHFKEKDLILDEIARLIQLDIDHAMKARKEFISTFNHCGIAWLKERAITPSGACGNAL